MTCFVYTYIEYIFSDAAVLGPADGVNCPGGEPAITGTRRPITPLSVFDGQSANGAYQFSVGDNTGDAVGKGTFGFWSLKLKLTNCPESVGNIIAAKTEPNDLIDLILDDHENSKYEFIKFIGLNVFVSILTSVFVIAMVYCICCRGLLQTNKNKSKGYGMIEPELNVDEVESKDELPIKENL